MIYMDYFIAAEIFDCLRDTAEDALETSILQNSIYNSCSASSQCPTKKTTTLGQRMKSYNFCRFMKLIIICSKALPSKMTKYGL